MNHQKRSLLVIASLAAALVTGAKVADAHQVGLSRGTYDVRGDTIALAATFSQAEMVTFLDGADTNKDSKLSQAELDAARATAQRALVDKTKILADGAACPGKVDKVTLDEDDGITIKATFTCPARPKKLSVELNALDDLSHGHRHIAHVTAGSLVIDPVLFAGRRSFDLDVPAAGAGDEPVKDRPAYKGKLSFVPLGIEHILTGYDHLTFLFALVLLGGRARDLLKTVTAFTVAHSISLALAVMGVWAPSPRIVEPAIALSIAYVGVENFFVRDASKRWRITFPFGLIHGFGFAGALQEISMPRSDLPYALVLFNLGVEGGQVAVLAVILPLILWARKREGFKNLGVRLLSAVVVAMGIIWFVLRVMDSA